MQSFYDYKKFAVLYIDDEELSLKYFVKALESTFRVYTANNAEDGLKIIQDLQDELAIVLSDQRMPGMQGVELLERSRQLRPRILRILVTAYTDLDAAIKAINNGAIYKYVSKPWEPIDLHATVQRAMEFFLLQREREELLKEKLSVLHNMMITDRVVSLGVLAAGLGHHIRNSLVAVRTFLDLAPAKLKEESVDLEQLRNPNFWNDFYQHVQVQIRRVSDMLTDLGVAGELRAEPFQDQIRVVDAVTKVIGKMQSRIQAAQVTVTCDIPDDLPELKVNGLQFHRVIELLLGDTLSSLPAQSTIVISGRVLDSALGKEVQLEITDDGPGLPEHALRCLFDPFFMRTAKPDQFGINLMTCYFLVYHHGGRIDVKQRPGGGTVFLVTFPTNPQAEHVALDEKEFLSKVLLNETLWEKLLAGN